MPLACTGPSSGTWDWATASRASSPQQTPTLLRPLHKPQQAQPSSTLSTPAPGQCSLVQRISSNPSLQSGPRTMISKRAPSPLRRIYLAARAQATRLSDIPAGTACLGHSSIDAESAKEQTKQTGPCCKASPSPRRQSALTPGRAAMTVWTCLAGLSRPNITRSSFTSGKSSASRVRSKYRSSEAGISFVTCHPGSQQ